MVPYVVEALAQETAAVFADSKGLNKPKSYEEDSLFIRIFSWSYPASSLQAAQIFYHENTKE